MSSSAGMYQYPDWEHWGGTGESWNREKTAPACPGLAASSSLGKSRKGKEKEGGCSAGSAPSKVSLRESRMLRLGESPCPAPGGMSRFSLHPSQPWSCVPPFWQRGGRGERLQLLLDHPGRERPWPRCLCSAGCLAQTKAVAPFVASVNSLVLSLAASRHLLLQPSTEQMPVWSSGGRENPCSSNISLFLPTGSSQFWQRSHLDSHKAQTALPPLHVLCSPPSSSPFPLTWILHTQIPESFGHVVLSAGTAQKIRVSISLCQAARRSRSGG